MPKVWLHQKELVLDIRIFYHLSLHLSQLIAIAASHVNPLIVLTAFTVEAIKQRSITV